MSTHTIQIKTIAKVTHNVLRFTTKKPEGYDFIPGQATEVAIKKKGWEEEFRPFTFTSLPEEDSLEFTIKTYTDHDGVTNKLRDLKQKDEFLIQDPFGAIQYEGEGTFIAGGAGVTPFIAILRQLQKENKLGENQLLFANNTKDDIILKEEFRKMLQDNFVNILSEEKTNEYAYGQISKDFLKAHVKDFDRKFYVCGPPPMMDAVLKQLDELEVEKDNIITEEM